MKKICLVWMFFFFNFFPIAMAEPVNLQIMDGNARTVLVSIARMGNLALILDDSVQGNVSVTLAGVEPEQALRMIASAKNFAVEKIEDTIIIKAKGPSDREFYHIHTFPIHFADLDVVLSAVNLSLGQAGISPTMQNIENGTKLKETETQEPEKHAAAELNCRWMADRATNALLFFGTDAEADIVQDIVYKLDVPAKQVSLEAKVVSIQKDATKNLGVEWDWSKLPQYPDRTVTYRAVRRPVQRADGSWTTATEDVPETRTDRTWKPDGVVPGILGFGKGPEGHPFEFYYEATLNALITNGKATVLARPNITTVQGREALINIGGEVPVPTVATTNATTTTSLSYRQAGIILRCVPRVNADGQITAVVHTEVSTPVYVDEMKAYKFQKRSADTMVRLKDGETMVIGGLIGSEESRSLSKVPFLGDLPILGAFFRNIKNSKTESEIMIFLTAHVLAN